MIITALRVSEKDTVARIEISRKMWKILRYVCKRQLGIWEKREEI